MIRSVLTSSLINDSEVLVSKKKVGSHNEALQSVRSFAVIEKLSQALDCDKDLDQERGDSVLYKEQVATPTSSKHFPQGLTARLSASEAWIRPVPNVQGMEHLTPHDDSALLGGYYRCVTVLARRYYVRAAARRIRVT